MQLAGPEPVEPAALDDPESLDDEDAEELADSDVLDDAEELSGAPPVPPVPPLPPPALQPADIEKASVEAMSTRQWCMTRERGIESFESLIYAPATGEQLKERASLRAHVSWSSTGDSLGGLALH